VPWPGRLSGGAGCQVALVITLIRGSICNPPHEQLLMDMWWVLVCHALGKVVGGCQHEAAGKRGVGCIPAPYGPLSAVPSHCSTPLISSFVHHPGHGVPVLGVIPRVFSLKNQLI
jgi:hypothetical protein